MLPQFRRDAQGPGVAWRDQTDDMGLPKRLERIAEAGRRCFRRVASSPECCAKCPTDLKPWPPFRLPRSHSPDKGPSRSLDDREHPEPTERPVADHAGERLPGGEAGQRPPV